jgi:hypothetical protein
MTDDDIDLTIPDCLDRKKNGHVPEPLSAYAARIVRDLHPAPVWPKKAINKALADKRRARKEAAKAKKKRLATLLTKG